MTSESDNRLYDDPGLAQFYDAATRQRDDFAFCAALAEDASSVLDLGCGTGELAARLAAGGRRATGVDPAAAMLDIGRRRENGDMVDWVEGDARSVRLGRTFDLVVLTGHAFQVFLDEADQAAALATIAAHLAPGGRFIFDSRNPEAGVRENRVRQVREIDHPEFGRVEAWNESAYDPATGVLAYTNGYRVPVDGRTFAAAARIRYTPQADLARLIAAAGLAVDRWLGDWQGGPFRRESSRDIIPVGRLASAA